MAGHGVSRAALLIANGAYDSPAFEPLLSPRQDCEGLAVVLGDPAIGKFGVERLVDATSYEVRKALERFLKGRGRDDTLLLHLSCHGIRDDEGRLHFAASDTERDLPASTAVSAAFLNERMEQCRARTIILLLDCCYSGAIFPGTRGDDYVGVREELTGRGRVILTATNRLEYAWEGEGDAMGPRPSRFTGALIEGLRSGAADGDGDGRITVTELYDYVYERVRRAGARQTPKMWADLEYRVFIADVGAGDSRPEPERRVQARDTGAPEQRRPRSGHPPSPPKRRAYQGEDVLAQLDVSPAEAASGTAKEFQAEIAVLCESCRGAETAPGTQAVRCRRCLGSGEIVLARSTGPCPTCRASGVTIPSPCPRCGGDGRVRERRTLTVRIPAGVRSGTRIRLAGEGDVGPGGGPPGDLYVEIR